MDDREATRLPDHPWNDPDGDGHNCTDCPASSIWKCDEARHIPDEVADTLQAAAQYLMGRGPAPDIDALTPELRDMVDELLPAITELVGDRIVPADLPSDGGEEA